MFHQFRLLGAEFSYKHRANRSERFFIMLVHNGVPELAYECQGQVRSRWPFYIAHILRYIGVGTGGAGGAMAPPPLFGVGGGGQQC